MSIGQRLQIVRKTKKMTQAQFADYLDVSSRTYTDYETDNRDPPLAIFLKLSDQDGFGIEWLITGSGPQKSGDISSDVEKAAHAALEYLEEDRMYPPSEKIAKMIRHLFNYLRSTGEIPKDYRDDYMGSAK